MTVHVIDPTAPVNVKYADVAYTGSPNTGAEETPYATLVAAHAASGAGDVVIIRPGDYTEDLVIAAAEDVSFKAETPGSVTLIGSCVITDATCTFEGINFIDDGAGTALHMTGVAADTCRFLLCEFDSTVGADHTVEVDNTAGVFDASGCRFRGDVGNANEVLRLESGTIALRECDVEHGSDVAQAIVCEGDAATVFTADDCHITGSVDSEAAVANPDMSLNDCSITVGAVAAINLAAGNTVNVKDPSITSIEGAQDAVLGAGTLLVLGEVNFLGTANEIACTASSHAVNSKHQGGTVAAAGASPQTDSVVFAEVLPTVNYQPEVSFEATGGGADDVSVSVDQGTIATTGFDVITTSISAAAISGNVRWTVDVD